MKLNPFKVILWLLFLIFVLLNSARLFIYGFVISFIIVIIDRAFFGTRKRSDKQFLNLFCTFTLIGAFCYSFSPFFRSFEFKISHPKWSKLEVLSIEKDPSKMVATPLNFLEKIYTPVTIKHKDKDGYILTKKYEIKHYALLGFEPFFAKETIQKELEYIHNRSLNKFITNKAINIYQNPTKDKLKMFKGNDAFALRHAIGFQIALFVTYLLAFILTLYCVFNLKKVKFWLKSKQKNEQKTALIILFLLIYSYLVITFIVIHYLKFK